MNLKNITQKTIIAGLLAAASFGCDMKQEMTQPTQPRAAAMGKITSVHYSMSGPEDLEAVPLQQAFYRSNVPEEYKKARAALRMRERLQVCIARSFCTERIEEIFLPADGSIVAFPFNPSYEQAVYGSLYSKDGHQPWGRLVGAKLEAERNMEQDRTVKLYTAQNTFRIE